MLRVKNQFPALANALFEREKIVSPSFVGIGLHEFCSIGVLTRIDVCRITTSVSDVRLISRIRLQPVVDLQTRGLTCLTVGIISPAKVGNGVMIFNSPTTASASSGEDDQFHIDLSVSHLTTSGLQFYA
jgi:hypothetical protein